MTGRQTHIVVEALRAAVDALMLAELSSLPAPEVTGLLAELERERRRLEAVDQRLLGEVVDRGIAWEHARTSPADLLITLLRVSPAEAKARLDRAADFGPRRVLTGAPLGPVFPVVAEAMRAGEIAARHAEVITSCLDRVSVVAPEATEVAEALLVEAAARTPAPVGQDRATVARPARPGRSGTARSRPATQARLHASQAARRLRRADGALHPGVDRVVGDRLRLVGRSGAGRRGRAGRPHLRPAPPRRTGRRRHALLRSNSLPASAGRLLTVLARTTMTELHDGVGVAIGGHAEQLSITQLLQMAGDAHVIPVICTDTGGILAYGRGRRLASREQRLALAARDGGCCLPGCDRPSAWTEVHHVQDWRDGGATDTDNMCLLCRYHHREFAKRGWEVVMIHGTPPAGSHRRGSTPAEDPSATPHTTFATSTSTRETHLTSAGADLRITG